jgi:hypothetical protein
MTAERDGAARVAYLITSYAQPDQVLRLARTLRAGSPGSPIVIHHDDRRSRLDEAALAELGGVELVRPSLPVAWGTGSQLVMHLRCFSWLVERVAFRWVVMLSGQDYPIRPLAAVERDLLASPFDGYVQGEPVPAPSWRRRDVDEFARRYFYRYRPIRPPGPRLRRAIAAARPLLLLRELPSGTLLGRRCATPFSRAFPCRRGSDWLTLSRAAVEALVATARARPAVVRHYTRAIVPSESFAPTVLHATPGLRLSADTRRYTSWRPDAHRPDVLGVGDLDRILASGADFARKFDVAHDAAVLDELDAVVGTRPG